MALAARGTAAMAAWDLGEISSSYLAGAAAELANLQVRIVEHRLMAIINVISEFGYGQLRCPWGSCSRSFGGVEADHQQLPVGAGSGFGRAASLPCFGPGGEIC